MQTVIGWIGSVLSVVMDWCYHLCGNYGWAIILFTLLSKVILAPLSVWVHLNGLKMVKMMPEINMLHVNHYGDKDAIAEGQAALYKREKYNPLAGIIPVVVQLIILLGLVDVIRRLLSQGNGPELMFLGLNLGHVPAEQGGLTLLVPLVAALSALVMCVTQNIAQPLQSEQGKVNQWTTLIISVGLSLYLGFFVPAGIGLYWIASNLFSVLQMYLLNWLIPPEKHVDYEALEKSRAALKEIEALDGGKKKGLFTRDENEKREKADYKRFFSIRNKHVVFYSEKSGFWKYYKDIIEELLKRSNLRIHYITNDPDDQIFEIAKKEPRIIPYYIGVKKLITLMMKLDADMFIMTTPDLENYHFKRSYIRKDIEYVYAPHETNSMILGFGENAFDHFDTMLIVGPTQMEEMRKREEMFGLPKKNLVPCGFVLLDDLIAEQENKPRKPAGSRKQILIAPSWQEDNLLDSCINELLGQLMAPDRLIIVRPHPEYMKRYKPRMDALIRQWEDRIGEGLRFETDFSGNSSIYESDLMVTDWSAISNEYCYTTGRPVLYINTKIKMKNPNWEKLGITPIDFIQREEWGRNLDKDQLDRVNEVATELLAHPEEWREKILKFREENIYNIGHCGQVTADYIISRLTDRQTKA